MLYDPDSEVASLPEPVAAVSHRIRNATLHHEATLAAITSISSASASADTFGGDSGEDGNDLLASLARHRSACPQPPLHGERLGGSAAGADGMPVVEMGFNPTERATPHRIVLGTDPADVRGGQTLFGLAGPVLGDPGLVEAAGVATLKAIMALAALCDESDELQSAAESLLPQLSLFGNDLRLNEQIICGGVGLDGERGESGSLAGSGDILMNEGATARRDNNLLRRMGKFVPKLQLAFNLTLRCQRLVRNMVCQLAGCASPAYRPYDVPSREVSDYDVGDGEGSPPIFGGDVHLLPLGEAIARTLRLLICIDAVVAQNPELHEAWDLYKSVMRDKAVAMQKDLRRDAKMESFERLLIQLDYTLMSSRNFITAVEQKFDPGSHYRAPTTSQEELKGDRTQFSFHDEVKHLLGLLYQRVCSRLDGDYGSGEKELSVGLYGLYCVYRRLLPSHLVPDTKLHKALWTLFPSRCLVVPLFGDIPFLPREFLVQNAPYEGLKGCGNTTNTAELRSQASLEFLAKRTSEMEFVQVVAKMKSEALVWLATAESELSPSAIEGGAERCDTKFTSPPTGHQGDPSIAAVEQKASRILAGVGLACRASDMLRSHLATYQALDVALPSCHVQALISLCEIIKATEKALLFRLRPGVERIRGAAIRVLAAAVFERFGALRSSIDSYDASIDTQDSADITRTVARISACLSVTEGILKGSSTYSPIRRYALQIAISACAYKGGAFDSLEISTTSHRLLVDLGLLSDMDDVIRRSCDCSFLYFQRELFVSAVKELCSASRGGLCSELGGTRLQLLLSAFSDPGKEMLLCSSSSLVRVDMPYFKAYQKFLRDVLHKLVIMPLCEKIETELRLAVYAKNQVQASNPTNVKQDQRQKFRNLLEMPPLHVCGMAVNVSLCVRQYLEATFYNFCTIALHDCQTYMQMRILAKAIYGIELVNNDLPLGSYQSNADVMQIKKNINDFVSMYNYDMSQQMFIQRRPDQGVKYFLSINKDDICASVRQHGLGIIRSSVDEVYTFLLEKYHSLSQVLVNDRIRSLISKELRWFNSQINVHINGYSSDRAAQLVKEIGNIACTNRELPILEQVRTALTQIGNALAFVRELSTAEMRLCCKTGMGPIPDSGNMSILADLPGCLDGAGFRPGIEEKRSRVRRVVDKFQKDIESEKSCMDLFYVLIPALCLSWTETSLQGKEMMHKKNLTRDAYFIDDGFALGVAFVLAVLGQGNLFDEMNWFASIRGKIGGDVKVLSEKIESEITKQAASLVSQKSSYFHFSRHMDDGAVSDDASQEDELSMLKTKLRKLRSLEREMNHLFFSIHGARIFFGR